MRLRAVPSATAAAVLMGSLLTGTSACTAPVACAGPCTGPPPYVLQVMFRPGTTTQAATATLHKCATGSVVERIGRLTTAQPSPSTKPYLITSIYTHAETVSHTGALLTCLHHAPNVQGAAFPG